METTSPTVSSTSFPPLASLPAQEKRISTRLTLALFVLLVGLAIHIDLAFSSNDITVIA